MKTPDEEFTDAMVAKLDAIAAPRKSALVGGLTDPRSGWDGRVDSNVDHVVLTALGWQLGVASRYLIDFRPPRDHTERFSATLLFARRIIKPPAHWPALGTKFYSLIIWRGRRSPWRTLNTYNGDTVPPYVAADGATHPGRHRFSS